MSLILKDKNKITLNSSDDNQLPLLRSFAHLFEKEGFDDRVISCGVHPCPDSGCFQLADRFWRASLCIYILGTTGGFVEKGAGFSEPWLFNVRHAVELYIKGLRFNSMWFEELQKNKLAPGDKPYFEEFKDKLIKKHGLNELYFSYKENIEGIIKKWNCEDLGDKPKLEKVLLSSEGESVIKEIDKIDKSSFRFRYPTLKRENLNVIQELTWNHDESKLLPITGLPMSAGYFFDHVKVLNAMNSLIAEFKSIESYFGGCWDYIGTWQDEIIMEGYREEFF